MRNPALAQDPATDAIERREWLESLDYVLQSGGVARAAQLLRQLDAHARQQTE
jgi:pyruvate dehydrogenase complex dehydrogenase (E1) component